MEVFLKGYRKNLRRRAKSKLLIFDLPRLIFLKSWCARFLRRSSGLLEDLEPEYCKGIIENITSPSAISCIFAENNENYVILIFNRNCL